MHDIHHLAECLKNNDPIPADLDISAYHIGKTFIHKYVESPYPEVLEMSEPFAQGSGWKWAQAAMDLGLSAVQAVEYACKKDIYTGGQVNHVDVIPRQSLTKPSNT